MANSTVHEGRPLTGHSLHSSTSNTPNLTLKRNTAGVYVTFRVALKALLW